MTPHKRNRQRARGLGRHPFAILALALLAAALAALPAVAATPATLELAARTPIYSEVTITLPDGTTADTSPGAFQLDITADGTTTRREGFCLDTTHLIGEGTPYSVSLQTAADDPSLASPANGQIAWLIQETPALTAAAPDAGFEAGAIQIAIWIIGGQVSAATPTDDAALNARAAALVALSAGKRAAGPVGISAAAASTCAGGAGTTLTVTGTPGATASLAVTSGQGTLSASQVTFDASGTATVGLTSTTPGAVQVTVTSQGAELTRATRIQGEEPQETGFLVPKTYSAAVTVTFTSCPPAAILQTPTTPVVRPQARPRLAVSKTAARSLRSGRRVLYTIVVRNPSRTAARNLVVRDTLPRGMAFARSSRKAASVGRVVTWNLGTLRAGASRTLRVWLVAPANLRGLRINVVTASATRARTVRAAAATRFTPLARRVQPAVTG